jgi:glutamate synthase domain-containing protein 3
MSGGIAYVWDPAGEFPGRVNREMVDLDPLDDEDVAFLRDRIERHGEETDSAVAERILGRFDNAIAEFVKVMPRDYKRVLAEAAAEAAVTA